MHVKFWRVFVSVVESKHLITFVNATQGSVITLPCLAQSGRTPTWLKNKEEKIGYKVRTYKLLHVSVTADIHILAVNVLLALTL